jgi:hypothetical protein
MAVYGRGAAEAAQHAAAVASGLDALAIPALYRCVAWQGSPAVRPSADYMAAVRLGNLAVAALLVLLLPTFISRYAARNERRMLL